MKTSFEMCFAFLIFHVYVCGMHVCACIFFFMCGWVDVPVCMWRPGVDTDVRGHLPLLSCLVCRGRVSHSNPELRDIASLLALVILQSSSEPRIPCGPLCPPSS